MPLARIFTHHPERTTALSSQLQQQGYTVEVARPDQANLAPADLEIEFEICERADVLERASDLADELQADIAVAPGVMQVGPQMVEDIPVHTAAVVEIPKPARPDAEREFEEAFAAQSELQDEDLLLSEIEIPVMERAPLPPVAFVEEPPMAARPMAAEIAKPADPVPYLAQLTPFGTPQVDGDLQGAALRLENSAEREPVRQMPAESPAPAPEPHSIWQRGADLTAKAVANARTLAETAATSFREHAEEYRMKAQVRSAEARAAHEARLLDLEQRRAEAQQRASELEAARVAAAARLVELVRQRDPGLHEESRPEDSDLEASLRQEIAQENLLEPRTHGDRESKAVPPPASQWTTTDAFRHASIAAMLKKRPPMSPQLRAVLTGAAAISALFVVGIVLGSLYPRTPLAKPSTQTANSTAAPGVSAQTGETAKAVAQQAKPAAGKTEHAPLTAAQSQPPAPTADKPSPKIDQTRRIAAQQGEEDLGDVVIRHYQRPVPTQKPKQSGQQAVVLKHFSDMN